MKIYNAKNIDLKNVDITNITMNAFILNSLIRTHVKLNNYVSQFLMLNFK
jgi:hypothetical protein